MKIQLLKLATLITTFLSSNVSMAQTWDSVLTGINKVMSNTVYPDCNEVLVLNGQDILAATLSGVYKSSNYGDTWTKKPIPGPTSSYVGDSYIGIKKVNNNRILALGMGGTLGNSIAKSDNGGNSWAASLTGITGNVVVEDLSVAPNGNIFIATRLGTSSPVVYLSTDNGDSWTPKNSGFSSSVALWSVLAVNDTIILAGANNGIYKTTNSGNTWTLVQSTGTGYVVCLKKNSAGVIYAGLASGVIRKSTDNGVTWTSVLGNSASVYDIEFDSSDNIYVCTYLSGITKYNSSEVFQTTIANTASGMSNTRLYDLAIDESASAPVLYASSVGSTGMGGCIYRYGHTSEVGIRESMKISNLFLAPNPASQTIQITGIDFNEGVRLKVISVDGKIVKDEAIKQSQIYVAELIPGMYFVELTDKAGKTGVTKFIKE